MTGRFITLLLPLPADAAALVAFAVPPVMPSPNVGGEAVRLLRVQLGGTIPFLDDAPRPFAEAKPSSRRVVRATPTLLINGCGRSGTHAMVGMLRRQGISALHEGHGREATVGWPYVGRLDGSWREYWPMSNQPHGGDAHDPIFKVHRHPLKAVRSVAAGLTSSGACRNPSERRWDARAWRCATRFIPLPVARPAIEAQETCKMGREARLRLALHYWVKWNLLADRWAMHGFQVETVTALDIVSRWCGHCSTAGTCHCPASAELVLLKSKNATLTRDRVKARKGHGKAKGAPLTWDTLASIDPNMTRVAQLLAAQYGYQLDVETRAA